MVVFLLAILFLGLVLRLINLGQSLWLDEAVQAIISQGPFLNIFEELRGDFHPPFYHLLIWLWGRIFGFSEISMRMPSVLFGVGTVYIVFLIAQKSAKNAFFTRGANRIPPLRWFSIGTLGRGPLVVAVFLASAPFHIYYCQEGRMYAMVSFFASLSMYFFIKLMNNKQSELRIKSISTSEVKYTDTSEVFFRRLPVAGYIFSTTAMLYTDYYGFLILLSQGIIIFLHRRYSLLLYCLVVLLFFLPWLPMFLSQLQYGLKATQILSEWTRLVNVNFFKALPLTFIKFIIGRITIFNKKLYVLVAGVLFLVYGGIIGGVISDQWSVIRKRKKPDTGYWCLVTILSWFFIPVLIAWVLSLFVPNYQPFRLLLVLPAFYLLLAIGINAYQGLMYRYIRPFLIFLVLGVNLVSLSVYYFNPYFHREDWRGVSYFIESQGKKALALLPSATSTWPWQYYSSGKADLLSISSGIREVSEEDFNNLKIENWQLKIYYIRYLVPLFDPQERINFWLKEQGFVKIKEISFNQIPIWEYKKIKNLK